MASQLHYVKTAPRKTTGIPSVDTLYGNRGRSGSWDTENTTPLGNSDASSSQTTPSSRGRGGSWDTENTTPLGNSCNSDYDSPIVDTIPLFGCSGRDNNNNNNNFEQRFLGDDNNEEHSESETKTEIEIFRNQKETFHIEDSWMIVPPEEEVVFKTDSEDSSSDGGNFTSASSSCSSYVEASQCSYPGGAEAEAETNLQEQYAVHQRHQLQPAIDESFIRNPSYSFSDKEEERKRRIAEKNETREARKAIKVGEKFVELETKPTEDVRSQHEADAQILKEEEKRFTAESKKLKGKTRQREAEAKALKEKKKLVEETRHRNTEAKTLQEKQLDDERRQQKAEIVKLEEEETRQWEAEAKSLQAKKVEDERRQEEAKAVKLAKQEKRQLEAEAERLAEEKRRFEAKAKALKAKKLEEERRQREIEEEILAEEERRRAIVDARARQAKKLEEERRQHKAEAKSLDEERRQREADAKALEAKAKIMEEERREREDQVNALKREKSNTERRRLEEEEKTRLEAEAEALESERINDKRKRVADDTKAAVEEERRQIEAKEENTREEQNRMNVETKTVEEKENRRLVKGKNRNAIHTRGDITKNRLANIDSDMTATSYSNMVGNLVITAINVGLAAVGSRVDGNIKLCQAPGVLDLGFLLDQHTKSLLRQKAQILELLQFERMVSRVDSNIFDARALFQKASPAEIRRWIASSSTVGNLAIGMAATPAACMVGNLATAAFGIGLAAIGSRIDGNFKVCQSPGVLDFGFVVNLK